MTEETTTVPVVSFLSDFGTTDESVGVCKAIITSLEPNTRIVDLTHDIPAYDIKAGALALVRAIQYLPSGIVLAAIDPTGNHRAIAVEVDGGILIGPDNGILAPAVAMLGGPTRVVVCTNPDYQLPSPGATFLARDVLAPAAGHLASGVEIEALGEIVDPASLTPSLLPLPTEDEGTVLGEVWWVDHFGNIQTNIDPDELRGLGAEVGATLEVKVGSSTRMARWAEHYRDAKPSELLLVADAHGLCSFAMDRASAAEALGVRAGAPVSITPPTQDGAPA
jgi:S-adenosylmethionine hydrolase